MESSLPPVFLAQHAHIHSEARRERMLGDFTEAELRQCLPGHNSIVWLLWHIARDEDLMVNTAIRGVPEVFDRGDWQARMGVTRRDFGAGWAHEDVAEFSAQVDIPALHAYRSAVGDETRLGLVARDFEDLDEPVLHAAQRALASGDLGPSAELVRDLMERQGKWWFLCWEVIGHSYAHLGEAGHIATLLGHPGD